MFQPIIESSTNITFICHQYTYPELMNQMQAAKLSIWDNKWNDVFDFTPNRKGKNYKVDPDKRSNFVTSLE